MSVVIVVFRLPPKVPNLVATRFCQRLYGQSVSSWGGKYRYRRTGVLDGIPHRKLLRGVVILRESDLSAVRGVLDEFGASVEVRVIQSTPEDRRALQPAAH
ncbi:hypothetical protein B1B_00439 [mine drainage metagenome]|uniref:Uncharacterized protein n=2 Tax=mine drainage metagenome TaxID=410659 RepID=T1C9S8_9ZZZZ